MKEKTTSIVGTILGVVGYLLFKELYLSMGVNSFVSILLAIATLFVIVFAVIFCFGLISNRNKSDDQKTKEMQEEHNKRIESKEKKEQNVSNDK